MKKIQILAVVALLMMFGCSKDNLIDTEQDSIVVDENKHFENGDIGSRRGDGGINGWNFVEFYGTSTGTDNLIICLPDDVADTFGLPGMDCGRKLQVNGYFSGNLSGYGKINSSLSTYIISYREPYWSEFPLYQNAEFYALYDDPTIPARFEKYQYNIEINGKVATSYKDYFLIKITAIILPMVPDTNGDVIRGSWLQSSDIEFFNKNGKLANYSDEYFKCGTRQIDGTNFQGINLETGEMYLFLNNIHF